MSGQEWAWAGMSGMGGYEWAWVGMSGHVGPALKGGLGKKKRPYRTHCLHWAAEPGLVSPGHRITSSYFVLAGCGAGHRPASSGPG